MIQRARSKLGIQSDNEIDKSQTEVVLNETIQSKLEPMISNNSYYESIKSTENSNTSSVPRLFKLKKEPSEENLNLQDVEMENDLIADSIQEKSNSIELPSQIPTLPILTSTMKVGRDFKYMNSILDTDKTTDMKIDEKDLKNNQSLVNSNETIGIKEDDSSEGKFIDQNIAEDEDDEEESSEPILYTYIPKTMTQNLSSKESDSSTDLQYVRKPEDISWSEDDRSHSDLYDEESYRSGTDLKKSVNITTKQSESYNHQKLKGLQNPILPDVETSDKRIVLSKNIQRTELDYNSDHDDVESKFQELESILQNL